MIRNDRLCEVGSAAPINRLPGIAVAAIPSGMPAPPEHY